MVKLAPPMRGPGRPADGILPELDPFSSDVDDHGEYRWEEVSMLPGSVSVVDILNNKHSVFSIIP